MFQLPVTSCLSGMLTLVSLGFALPIARATSPMDTIPKAYPLGPALVLSDAAILGRWEINSHDKGAQEDTLNRGRMVIHFYPDHSMEFHGWNIFTDSGDLTPDYKGVRISGTWFIRDTLLGVIYQDCQGFNADSERECGYMSFEEGLDHDTDWNVVKPQGSKRYLVDKDMSGMLAFLYRGADRDVTPPAFWTGAAALRPKGEGAGQRHGSGPETPFFDLLGRRPALPAAVMPRFVKPGPGRPGGV